MKKTIFYALIAVMSFTFVSCEQTVDEKKLLGKWKVIEFFQAEYLNDRLIWSETTAYEEYEELFIEFLAEGQYVSSLWGVGTYSLSEDANRIYLKNEEGYWPYSILELTKSNLELLFSETEGTEKWEECYRFVKE